MHKQIPVAAAPLMWNRPRLRFLDGAPEGAAPVVEAKQEATSEQKMLTQAEVDQIVKERVQRERAKFADYDELRAKAGETKTLEERLAEIEQRAVRAEANALRSDIAAKHGISPEDRDLFLTGTDEDTLTAQAKRLAERESERKKQGNVAPREGAASNSGQQDGELREFTRRLFGQADQ